MRHLAFVGLVALWCGVDKASDLDRLQGTWEIVALVEKGKAIPADEIKTLEVVITGARLKINSGGKTVSDYQVRLDGQPKTIDLTLTEGPDKGQVAPGIYVLDGDTLQIGVDEEFKNRPASFDEKDTKSCSVITLKRKKMQ
jgi:uncharacterized protein (TIGR03067 family)